MNRQSGKYAPLRHLQVAAAGKINMHQGPMAAPVFGGSVRMDDFGTCPWLLGVLTGRPYGRFPGRSA